MFILGTTFIAPDTIPDWNQDHVFRYCEFENITDAIHNVHIDAVFLGCTFRKNDFYWSLFNGVLAYDCTFEDCTFRGVSFADCRFLDCSFERCVFTNDNLGGSCGFEGTKCHDCYQRDCVGLSTAAVPLRATA